MAEKILKEDGKEGHFLHGRLCRLAKTSCNPKVTEDLLKVAGPQFPTLFTRDGPLKPLTTPMQGTLKAKARIRLSLRSGTCIQPGRSRRFTSRKPMRRAQILAYVPEIIRVNFAGNSSKRMLSF